MVISDLLVEEILERVELKYVMTTNGAQCVMTCGQILMGMWPASSLDSLQMVRMHIESFHIVVL